MKIIFIFICNHFSQPTHLQHNTTKQLMQTQLEAYGFKRLSFGGMPGSATAGRTFRVPELFSERVRPSEAARAADGQEPQSESLVLDFSEGDDYEGGSPGPAPSQTQGCPEGGVDRAGASQRW